MTYRVQLHRGHMGPPILNHPWAYIHAESPEQAAVRLLSRRLDGPHFADNAGEWSAFVAPPFCGPLEEHKNEHPNGAPIIVHKYILNLTPTAEKNPT